MDTFDLTPDPKVLIALTHTALQPLDALCELIDNALDSFEAVRREGSPVEYPLTLIEIPGRAEVDRGDGFVRVRDNGPGLTFENAEKALRAGYSGKQAFGTLGLFGMGFNIATGKIGRVTRFITARKEDDRALETVIDLVRLQEARSYQVVVNRIAKPEGLSHGTVVEISGWWPEGNQNAGFIKKLASYTKSQVREEIGRRYATLLRSKGVRIQLNNEPCEPFEHCSWNKSRFVERRGHGKIPAVIEFDETIGHQRRCLMCSALVPALLEDCPVCHSSSFRTIPERVKGWVGIQRFDDPTNYGIDLIRNGRAIRVAEKAAFFEYTDEFKKTTKDYPIDSPYGRIIGEVHIDHVPVDFLKQDFQRSTEEWLRAISYLRGDSSLQPKLPGADKNESPVFKLFQGYRRVRTPGKADAYMGYWDSEPPEGPKRISRTIEEELYEKFRRRLPGYYDDAEWWKLVEQADQRPLDELVECPQCQAQNLKEREACDACGHILRGKTCITLECGTTLPLSAVSCPVCGASQVPEIEHPWACDVCGAPNPAGSQVCGKCANPQGSPPLTSMKYLLSVSDKADELSISGLIIELADRTPSQPLSVNCYVSRVPLPAVWGGPHLPSIVLREEAIEVFIDKSHPLFRAYGVRPVEVVATEVAQYLYAKHLSLASGQNTSGGHTVSTLLWRVLEGRWGDDLRETPDKVREVIRSAFDNFRARLATSLGAEASDVFDELSEEQKKQLVANLLGQSRDISQIGALKTSGEFVMFVDPGAICSIFLKRPNQFFDGRVWRVQYASIPELPEAIVLDVQNKIRAKYQNCLEDVASYLNYQTPELLITQRARSSVEFLLQKLD